jgi:SpoVK/Ycf46/Vps4 family AAA+-type ATPase
LKEYPETSARKSKAENDLPIRRKHATKDGAVVESSSSRVSRKPVPANISSPRHRDRHQERDDARRTQRKEPKNPRDEEVSSQSVDDDTNSSGGQSSKPKRKVKQKQKDKPILAEPTTPTSDDSASDTDDAKKAWEEKVKQLMKNLPKGVDEGSAKQIFNEIVVHGDEVHWEDVAGLDIAKNALKEAVVYPFLRPDLFMGLREPARGMLLFGPPGTGKTMLARAVATESKSTFFSISASSLTSKYLGESEKLVRALFSLAKALAPSIIFVDEIDSLLSSRSGSGEHEATRRIKTEFLIQWSDLQRAAAGREQSEKEKERGDASRVLVLAATNLPWAIDEAARRRFVRRQYIPLPEDETRATQLRTLLGHQKHSLDENDIQKLVELTDGMPLIS